MIITPIPLANWQIDLYKSLSMVAPCDMVNMRLMMVSFVHKQIMDKPSV